MASSEERFLQKGYFSWLLKAFLLTARKAGYLGVLAFKLKKTLLLAFRNFRPGIYKKDFMRVVYFLKRRFLWSFYEVRVFIFLFGGKDNSSF